jgi:lipopolysaccharide/colanic/teichoic acid biosynthesis glycosyltransferase
MFTQWKFRSMYRDAERRLEEQRALSNTGGPSFKAVNDPRVTRVGRLLRRTSLDELPQVINVIRGQMSLVGPRPVQAIDFRGYPNALARRNYVKPGITGLWQVQGRSDLPFPEMVRLDLEYVDRASFWLNVWVLIRTIPAVLSRRGAY